MGFNKMYISPQVHKKKALYTFIYKKIQQIQPNMWISYNLNVMPPLQQLEMKNI